MLTKNSRRVVIIDKIKSDMIEQAIFILKGTEADAAAAECGIVAEAQGIIENYIKRMNKNRAKARAAQARASKRLPLISYFAVSGTVILALVFAAYIAGIF